ncbi:MAG: hypothetical protein U0R80_04920 [Nocardioidaceae bacterium]
MCDHRLWPDVAAVVCRRTDPHEPGTACHYVADVTSDDPVRATVAPATPLAS